MGRVIDAVIAYRVLKLLVTPFNKTQAYKMGIIDDKGNAKVEVTQFGGRYGKTPESKPMGDVDIENGDGVSHKKEGGLKIEFNWEKQANNTYKVFANLV